MRHLIEILRLQRDTACDIHTNPGPNVPDNIKIFHANIRSIKSDHKLDELLFNLAQTEHFDIIMLSETWLDNNTPLNQHLFQINAVPSPMCKCGDSEETISHFFLKCTLFDNQRLKLLTGIRDLLAPGLHPLFLVHLVPRHLIDIFLYGSPEQPDCINEAFCSLVQTYIIETKRFVY